eukprot:5669052-Alexandrium_andersonii.AAC.1
MAWHVMACDADGMLMAVAGAALMLMAQCVQARQQPHKRESSSSTVQQSTAPSQSESLLAQLELVESEDTFMTFGLEDES